MSWTSGSRARSESYRLTRASLEHCVSGGSATTSSDGESVDGPLPSPCRGLVLALSIAILVGAAPTEVAGQNEGWPMKEFEVINVAPLNIPRFDGTPLERLLIRASRLLPFDAEAAGLRTVPSDGDLARALRVMETRLNETATQLEAWRLPPPLLEPVVTRNGTSVFRTYLVDAIPEESDAVGKYDRPVCDDDYGWPRPETIITLSADLALRRTERPGADGGTVNVVTITDWGLDALSHELFHAVQFATSFYEDAKCGNLVGAWITEGTARAVGMDIARALGNGLPSEPPEALWGRRNYSEPLAIPAVENDQPAYNTSSFWRYLAELYAGGRPGPAPAPVDYGYLADFLSTRPSGRDCVKEGDPCDTEVARLDGWLKSAYGSNGLREYLPRFLAAYVHYGAARGKGETAESRNKAWRDASFEDGCMSVELSPASMEMNGVVFGGLFHVDTVSVKNTAARCWSVEPTDFESGLIGVEAEVRSASDRVLSQIVAVRAPRQEDEVSVQEAIVEVNQVTGEPRARFMFPFRNGEKTPFLLVNVARDAQTTTDIEDMPVRFTALESYAVITSGASSSGPSGADVDRPLEVRFDEGLQGVVSDAATGGRYDPALSKPCMLRVPGLSNAGGDQLWFGMDHEGPIGPGVYPVADHRRIGVSDPLPAGKVDAVFRLGFLNQPPAEQLQEFVGTAGTLTVEAVSGRLVTGVLELVGENSRAEDIALKREKPPANYLPNAVIRVEFGLLMSDPGEPVRDSGTLECLTSKSPGPHAVSGNGGGPAGPTQPGADDPDDPGPPDGPGTSGSPGAAPGPSTDEPEGPGGPPAGDGPAAPGDGARPSEAATAGLGPGKARWVSVRVKGRPDLSFRGSDLDGSAGAEFGCFGTTSSAELSLHPGPSGQTASLGLIVITSLGIAEGATGSFPLDQVMYVVGGGTLGWRGPATLEISRHQASADPGARRVAGRILGLSAVDRETGALRPVEAEFDVNAACAPFGR